MNIMYMAYSYTVSAAGKNDDFRTKPSGKIDN